MDIPHWPDTDVQLHVVKTHSISYAEITVSTIVGLNEDEVKFVQQHTMPIDKNSTPDLALGFRTVFRRLVSEIEKAKIHYKSPTKLNQGL